MKYILFFIFIIFSFTSFSKTKILFIGDSLTEGYGIAKTKAYPSLIGRTINKKTPNRVEILNGSVSGSTTASGLSRLKWFLKGKPQILVLSLGANDGLRGLSIEKTKNNLSKIIDLAQKNKMKVILAGMLLPPNYGKDYRKKFKEIFSNLSKEKKITLIPFLLEGVAAKPKLNLADGIHPNEKGHEIIAKTVMKYLKRHL